MIRTIVFDLGGVIFNIDKRQAIRRFNEAGFADAARYLDAFHQVGIEVFYAGGMSTVGDGVAAFLEGKLPAFTENYTCHGGAH